jgi:hypothetical protein
MGAMGTSATPAIGLRRSSPTACRDRELLRFIGRHGAVSIEHVMAALGTGPTMAYRRVAACVERGLIVRVPVLRDEPSLLIATRDGLRYAGLSLPLAVSPGSVEHWLRCASVALELGERHGHERVLTEREVGAAEQIERRPIASAKLGELPSGRPRLHRPDLALLLGERPTAIEVELTAKSPRRLDQILRAWRRASWVAEVRYLCPPGASRRALERAIARTRTEGCVRVEVPPR